MLGDHWGWELLCGNALKRDRFSQEMPEREYLCTLHEPIYIGVTTIYFFWSGPLSKNGICIVWNAMGHDNWVGGGAWVGGGWMVAGS